MSYQDYLNGFRDGYRIGFNDGVKKGFILGQNSKYLQGYKDEYKGLSLDLPYKGRELLDEVKLKIPTIDPLPTLKDKYEPELLNYDPPKKYFEPLPKYELEPVLSKFKPLKKWHEELNDPSKRY